MIDRRRHLIFLLLLAAVAALLLGCDPKDCTEPNQSNCVTPAPPSPPTAAPGPIETRSFTPSAIDLRPTPATTAEPIAHSIDGRGFSVDNNEPALTSESPLAVLILRDRTKSVAELCEQDDSQARVIADFLYEFMATQFDPPSLGDEGNGANSDGKTTEPRTAWQVAAWIGQGVIPPDDPLPSNYSLHNLANLPQGDWKARAEAVWGADTVDSQGFLAAITEGAAKLRAAVSDSGAVNPILHLIVIGDGMLAYNDDTEWDNVQAGLVNLLRDNEAHPIEVHLSYVLINCDSDEGDSSLVNATNYQFNLNQWAKLLPSDVVLVKDQPPGDLLIKVYGHDEMASNAPYLPDDPYPPEEAIRQLLADLFTGYGYLPPNDAPGLWTRQRAFLDQGDEPDALPFPIPGYANAGSINVLSLDEGLTFKPDDLTYDGASLTAYHQKFELELAYRRGCPGRDLTLTAPPTTPTLIWWDLQFPYLERVDVQVNGDHYPDTAQLLLHSQLSVSGNLSRPIISDGEDASHSMLHCFEYAVVVGDQQPADDAEAWRPFDPEQTSFPFEAPFTVADLDFYDFTLPLTLFVRRAINYPGAEDTSYNVLGHSLSVRAQVAYRPTLSLDPTQASSCKPDRIEVECTIHVLYATPDYYLNRAAPEADYLFLTHQDNACIWKTGGANLKATFRDDTHPLWYAYNTKDEPLYEASDNELLSKPVTITSSGPQQVTTIELGVPRNDLVDTCGFEYFAIRYKKYDGDQDAFIACPLNGDPCIDANLRIATDATASAQP